MSIPISCKTTTYGRVNFLEEMLQSFLMQQYEGDYEMVIVNDYPLQTLHFDHPKVRIINLKETFPVIGEKENFAVEQCKYNTIATLDDDDIVLPNHLSNINKYFPGHELLHWQRGIAMVSHTIRTIKALGNCGIVYDRQFLRDKLGGYPLEQAGADMTLVINIKKAGARVARADPPDSEVSQIYNWGNGSYHLSGQGRDKPDRKNIIQRHTEHIENLRKKGKIPTGDIELKPHWNRAYDKLLKDYING
jgi:glycosyltransferase involved in cell wall biosynthesis